VWHRDRRTRTECDAIEGAAIFAERGLGFGAAVDVVEDDARQPALRRTPEIVDADDAMRSEPSNGHVHVGRRTRRAR